VTSGLLTAEGGGGDLASVLTAADHQQAIPRLVYALYGKKASKEVLNDVIQQLLRTNMEDSGIPAWSGEQGIRELASDAWRIFRAMRAFLHSGDGWTVLCEFLFFLSPYVRELLEKSETEVESVVQLEEVLSALSLAAGYRFGHRHVRPRSARLGLAERMRELVTQSAPGLVPPQRQPGAVRVMTCHASKGLEFPCVLVVGQSLPEVRAVRSALPPRLRPDPNEDLLQAESLLFVGLSRAERCAVISRGNSASGRPRSTPRKVPSLLTKLESSKSVPVISWSAEPRGEEEIEIGRIWGGDPPSGISTFSLSKNTCRVRTYLEEDLDARFRGRQRLLYPEFMSLVRRTLRRIVECAIASRSRVPEAEAVRIAEEEWPPDRHKDHMHLAIYRPRLIRWAKSFARAFDPGGFPGAQLREEPFELIGSGGNSRTIKLQLVAQLEKSNGGRFAVAVRVGRNGDSQEFVKWSELKDYERLPFVLLHERYGNLEPLVFFGEDGLLCSFQWSRAKPEQAIREQAVSARTIAGALTSGKFHGKLDDWTCDRCPCRTICPAWLGASTTAGK
jgi:hypothetical protein